MIAIAGIFVAYRIYVVKRGTSTALRERFAAVYELLWHKWYFDEAIDLLIVRPMLWFGRVADTVLERSVIQGFITGGAVGVVRAGSAAVRRFQTGFLRYYAAGMVVCIAGVALYFLVSSS